MTDTPEIFSGDDPIALAQAWLNEAAANEINDPNAMTLATVDASGMPNARIVLLKEIEPAAFVFFTNYNSAKGVEMATSGKAAICLHWKSTRRQVRARGIIERVSAAQSDAYYASRPVESRLGAWASQQSEPLETRDILVERLEKAKAQYSDSPPRPAHWGGYRLTPLEIEFWSDQPSRLHDRFQWKRKTVSEKWKVERLYP